MDHLFAQACNFKLHGCTVQTVRQASLHWGVPCWRIVEIRVLLGRVGSLTGLGLLRVRLLLIRLFLVGLLWVRLLWVWLLRVWLLRVRLLWVRLLGVRRLSCNHKQAASTSMLLVSDLKVF